MGSGLAGGPLTGQPISAALPPAPAGESAVLSGPLGAGATDVVAKIGSTAADATVSATAKLASFRTGIGTGTEVEAAYVVKEGFGITGGWRIVNDTATGRLRVMLNALTLAVWDPGTGYLRQLYGLQVMNAAQTIVYAQISSTDGSFSQYGIDSSGTPGAATINKPTGKSAIALGAASVVITNSLVAATSRIIITPETRDATCKELIAVPGAGSFTVSGSANATADLIFSWQVSNIL